jgi:cell division protein FtsZ
VTSEKYQGLDDLRPKITVAGIGGAGGNAVNNMILSKLEGVKFLSFNTDAQAIGKSLVSPEGRICLGESITQGLGAGSRPEVGKASAEESIEDVIKQIQDSNMVFITAGMGGGTGTGAAPVVARAARESGILTVGVVTKPFHFEGSHRMRTAEKGIEELEKYVDTLIVIPNQNLFRVANERTTFADAFKMADDVLYSGVRGVTDLIIMPGLINLDFADIRAVMAEMGKAMMGTGEAEGDKRALNAAEAAISNPLLDDVSMKGAKGVLINITGGLDMTLYEVDEAANRVRDDVDPEANIIFGSTFDERLNGKVRVSVVATGIGGMKTKKSVSKPQQSFSEIFEEEVERQEEIKEEQESQEQQEETFVDFDQNNNQTTNFQQKKAPSLFERFTGVNKQKQKTTFVSTPINPVHNFGDNKENYDIPAFLRRGNNSSKN